MAQDKLPYDKQTTPTPPEAWEPLLRFSKLATRPLERFLKIEAASGILLLLTAAIALAWANSPRADSYKQLWEMPIGISVGTFAFERSLAWIVNDGLMVIFFFVVGMEIRREIHHGELSEWKRASLPVAAALGGMLVPAAMYLSVAGAPETHSGWGVPMATDIAFAVGVLTLLGRRVPAALRVLLLAVAVIDDLGAILVIAFFYSSGVDLTGFGVAALGFTGVLVMQRLGVRSKLAYIAPAIVAWAGIYKAGVHPTIAGVIVGLMTPVTAWLGPEGFLQTVRRDLDRLSKADLRSTSSHDVAATLRHINAARREVLSPAEGLIETLHPWVAYGIMPIFALANAGVVISADSLNQNAWMVISGVTLGLVVGKPIGIVLLSWIVLKLKLASLPLGISIRHLCVLGFVAGIGFTMSLFIAPLAFSDDSILSAAKIGVLGASGISAVLALLIGNLFLSPIATVGAAQSADEAESSTEL